MDQSNPKDHRTHITVLLDFLRDSEMPNVSELIALCNPANVVKSISFASLWFLFTPGTFMVKQDSILSHSRVFLIDKSDPLLKRSIEKANLYMINSSSIVRQSNTMERPMAFTHSQKHSHLLKVLNRYQSWCIYR